MLKRISWIRRRAFSRSTRGFTLTEVMIAIVVLGIVVASVPLAILTINNIQFKQNELRIAERMVRAQFEYIKNHSYESGNTSAPALPDYGPPLNIEVASYYIDYWVYPICPDDNCIFGDVPYEYGDHIPPQYDQGIQEIVIWVFRGEGEIVPLYETSNYKVLR